MSLPDTALQRINLALSRLGKPPLATLSDQNENARTMLAVFSDVARAELRRHAWSFAMDRTTLAADSTPPKFDYSNAFVLPGDYLRLVVLNDLWIDTSIREAAQEDLPIYTIEGKRILANLDAPLRIRYVTDVTNAPDTWDALFCEVFALALARAAAPTLVKSEARIKTLREDYQQAVFDAKRANAIELPPREKNDASWITSRQW